MTLRSFDPPRIRWLRCGLAWAATLFVWSGISLGVAWAEEGATPPTNFDSLRIAVAHFAGASDKWPVAESLSRQIALHPLGRLIPPGAFVAAREFDPDAARVRQWAYNAAVDTVIVGQLRETSALSALTASGKWEIEAVLRSGHSGAEVSRHVAVLAGPEELEAATARLANEILAELGFPAVSAPPPGTLRDPRSPEPALLILGDGTSDGAAKGGDGALGTGFEFGGLRGDAPIEIKADEAEIVDRGEGRTLVFQRNVRVRQGDVTLASDRLEAEYRKGQSEPDRLIAVGSVEIGQGHRRAKCDRAVYMRVEQRLSCEGRAELLQGCDIVRGRSIEFDLGSEKARVVGAASIVIRPGEATDQGCVSTASSASPEGVL
jgi:lipopolysaccharide transport protein LptA